MRSGAPGARCSPSGRLPQDHLPHDGGRSSLSSAPYQYRARSALPRVSSASAIPSGQEKPLLFETAVVGRIEDLLEVPGRCPWARVAASRRRPQLQPRYAAPSQDLEAHSLRGALQLPERMGPADTYGSGDAVASAFARGGPPRLSTSLSRSGQCPAVPS
jgi:hypothetical protein